MFDACILRALLLASGLAPCGGLKLTETLNPRPDNHIESALKGKANPRQGSALIGVFLQNETVSLFLRALLKIYGADPAGGRP
jgi:hypothetical protein